MDFGDFDPAFYLKIGIQLNKVVDTTGFEPVLDNHPGVNFYGTHYFLPSGPWKGIYRCMLLCTSPSLTLQLTLFCLRCMTKMFTLKNHILPVKFLCCTLHLRWSYTAPGRKYSTSLLKMVGFVYEDAARFLVES